MAGRLSLCVCGGLPYLLCLPCACPAQVEIRITPGTHASEHAVNKQLNDKERVAAALENEPLLKVVNKCIAID